ncbi:MAG: DUF559 domain-containing protein [Emticicia sp.]|nr:DUF559 domain-containing protein [Emticicia sp.]
MNITPHQSPAPLLEGEGGEKKPSPSRRGLGEVNPLLNSPYKSPFGKVSTELQKKARDLRKNATKAEAYLWELLRNRQLNNQKIRRQHPLEEGFILDFYCQECRLGIELDGKYHDGIIQQRYDDFRTREIEAIYKIKIIRFTNDEVLNEIDRVLEEISLNLITSPLTPLLGGEGDNNEKPFSFKERGWGEATDASVNHINISAKNNIGIDELKAAIVTKAKAKKQADTMLTNLRHYEHLVKANDALSEVLNGLDIGITGDFLAQDIRLSLHHLGEITGAISSDDLLANIFSKFCIGK